MAVLFRQFLKLGIREIKVSGLFCKLTSGLIVKKIFFVESSSEEKESFVPQEREKDFSQVLSDKIS